MSSFPGYFDVGAGLDPRACGWVNRIIEAAAPGYRCLCDSRRHLYPCVLGMRAAWELRESGFNPAAAEAGVREEFEARRHQLRREGRDAEVKELDEAERVALAEALMRQEELATAVVARQIPPPHAPGVAGPAPFPDPPPLAVLDTLR